MATIKNGRLVGEVPASGISGDDLIQELKPRGNRRAVLLKGTDVETIERGKNYTKRDLISQKTGRSVQMKTMPDRTKGQVPLRIKGASKPTYDKKRDRHSKRIILEQIQSISENFYKDRDIEFDGDDCNWVVFPEYILPKRWSSIARTSPLLITFPMEYPKLPPVGFYLRATLPKSPNGHLYEEAYHSANEAPLAKGWVWYCVYINHGDWKPARYRKPGDWNHGDNLWDYLTLINEALSSQD